MLSKELPEILLGYQDPVYQQFQQRLLPSLNPEAIIGVRTPILRELAKQVEDSDVFCAALPHRYFEENQIHAFLIEREKDFDTAIARVQAFLPYVDNWATCDQLKPRAFRAHEKLLPRIPEWLASEKPYTVRFGIEMLMNHFLNEDFSPEMPEMVASVQSEEYYVNMMIAWYFATALAKQYNAVLPYITGYRLEKWIHNKAIQKSIESYRISPEQKEYLKSFRIK